MKPGILFLFLLSACKPEPKFKRGDRLCVKSGFERGRIGVARENVHDRYLLRFSDVARDVEWVDEDDLELCEGNAP